MLYKFGRVLQVAGLIVLPVAIAGNVARPEEITLWRSLGLSAVGIALFAVGWLLQQSAPPR
ncbi:MAG: hypothetical protein ACK4RK_14670 [Gemmataceae bacterium]